MQEPVLISIATALAGRAAGALHELVRGWFDQRPGGLAVLEAAAGAAPGSPPVRRLAEELDRAGRADPAFAERLRSTWDSVSAARGGVVNQISGNVTGKVVQARDISGGVSF